MAKWLTGILSLSDATAYRMIAALPGFC